MILTYGVVGALGVFYCAIVGVWAWAMVQGLQSRLPELVRRRQSTSR